MQICWLFESIIVFSHSNQSNSTCATGSTSGVPSFNGGKINFYSINSLEYLQWNKARTTYILPKVVNYEYSQDKGLKDKRMDYNLR